ncbi:glycan-binding surface protein [Chitinophaga pollutisoli]|uniref:Glycan-binding surface protein n=1 Tax=Chitinophaga pollutisoli TaxID=3133966 RepID=A0ABZ2YS74_9BACT
MIKNIRLLLAGMLLVLAAACSKDDGVSGPPVIHRVTLLDSSKMDSAFTRAYPGIMILITGENLAGATRITFNNFNAYFNPAYNTNTHIIMNIPGDATTEATDPDVPNELRIKTDRGDAVHQFVLDIPPPSISWIENENALAGDSMVIYGSALWLVNKITLPGGRDITEYKGNLEGDRLAFVMPDLQGDTGRLAVVAKYGTAYSVGPLNDHESGDVISNLTNAGETGEAPRFNWQWWGADRSNDAARFPGTRGHYLISVFGAVPAGDGAWWNSGRSGQFDDVQLFDPAVRSRPTDQYALKFEFNTKEPWTAGVLLLRFNNGYSIRWTPFKDTESQAFHTNNKWITVTFPLNAVRQTGDEGDGTGPSIMSMGDLVLADGKVPFKYWFIAEEEIPIDIFHAAFDNFRIVKIK